MLNALITTGTKKREQDIGRSIVKTMIRKNDIVECKSCPICSESEYVSLAEVYFEDFIVYSTEYCENCGQIFRCRKPSLEFWEKYWGTISESDIKIDVKHENRRYNRYLNIGKILFEVCEKNESILDVGCGIGTGLKAYSDCGWNNVVGVEISQSRTIVGRKTNKVNILNKPIEEYNPSEKFSCVTLVHSFEHLSDPMIILKKLSELVDYASMVYLEVPNFRNFVKWDDVVYFAHLQNFSEYSLILSGLKHSLSPVLHLCTKTQQGGVSHLGIVFRKESDFDYEKQKRNLSISVKKLSLSYAMYRYSAAMPLNSKIFSKTPIKYKMFQFPINHSEVIPELDTSTNMIHLSQGRISLYHKFIAVRNLSAPDICSLIYRKLSNKNYLNWKIKNISNLFA